MILIAVAMDLLEFEITTAYWLALAGLMLVAATFAIIRQNLFVFVLKRLGEAGFVIWIIATATFLLLRFIPGGPFDQEKALAPEIKANIEAKYGLNRPMIEQYGDYLMNLVQGDL